MPRGREGSGEMSERVPRKRFGGLEVDVKERGVRPSKSVGRDSSHATLTRPFQLVEWLERPLETREYLGKRGRSGSFLARSPPNPDRGSIVSAIPNKQSNGGSGADEVVGGHSFAT